MRTLRGFRPFRLVATWVVAMGMFAALATQSAPARAQGFLNFCPSALKVIVHWQGGWYAGSAVQIASTSQYRTYSFYALDPLGSGAWLRGEYNVSTFDCISAALGGWVWVSFWTVTGYGTSGDGDPPPPPPWP